MAYDITKDYVAVSDGYNGVRLVPRPHVQLAIDRFYGVKTTDALPNTTDPKTGFKQATKTQNTLPPDCDGDTEDKKVRDRKRFKSRGSWDQLPGSSTPPAMASQETAPFTDQEPDADEDEQVLGVLPPADPGMTYILRPDPDGDGSVAVVSVPDDGGQIQANTGDNRRSWSDSKTRSILNRMNKANRAHFRDAATSEKTIFTHTPAKDERMELREDPRFEGRWQVILISPATNIIGEIPPGAQDFSKPSNEDEDEQRQGGRSDTPETGEHRATSQRRMTGDHATALKLRQMNLNNRRYWSSGNSTA